MINSPMSTFSWHLFFHRRLKTLAILSIFAMIFGQLGQIYWFLELFSHFVPHYTVVIIAASFFCFKPWRYVFSIFAGICLFWLFMPIKIPPALNFNRSLVWYNVNLNNRQAIQESERLIKLNTDVVALAEINPHDIGWQKLRQHYPYGCQYEELSPFAMTLWAKKPLEDCRVYMVNDLPYIRAQFGNTIIYALHPPPPINATLVAMRQQYLETIATRIPEEKHVLVVGDFNSSSFSPTYRRFLEKSGMLSKMYYGVPTWKPFFIHIDHVLSRHTLHPKVYPQNWLGSDHRPLLIKW